MASGLRSEKSLACVQAVPVRGSARSLKAAARATRQERRFARRSAFVPQASAALVTKEHGPAPVQVRYWFAGHHRLMPTQL